jgi:hypothetical protein
MDKDPKTRQEKKGKHKEGKKIYNQKTIRIQESLRENSVKKTKK